MFDAMLQGLLMVLEPYRMIMLMVGVAVGTAVAISPGIGATVAIAILIPFLVQMEPVSAVAMMMGVFGVINTADSITAILLGIPGTAGGAATIVEGHTMARKGQASRALSASFTASLIGGIIGAVGLGLSIPVLGILITQFGSPEFLMLSILGITAVAGLGGGQAKKGLLSAGIGLLMAGLGGAPLTPYYRYTMGMTYLYDGIPLVVVALGIFGLPEMIELVARGTPIGGLAQVGSGIWQGVRDCLTHFWLILRCSIIGLYVGFAPGAGPSIAAWLSYAHAVQSARTKDGFGKGDVRGLVAPECSNNACRGGDLVVTLLFGVPGSASCALIMMTLIMFGIFPGPDMVEKNLALTYSFTWSLAISTVIGALVCFAFTRQLARIAFVPIHTLAPLIIIVIVMGAFQSSQSWGDLLTLLMLAMLGVIMKETGFPRPPLLVGFVLGGLCERYLGLSIQRYGFTWLYRPWVVVLTILIILALWAGERWTRTGIQVERGEL